MLSRSEKAYEITAELLLIARGSPEDAMCKFLPFSHFYGLVIVPVLAMMLAFPASAQISSNSETQSTSAAVLINIDKSKQKMTVFLDGVEKYVWPVSTGLAGYSTPSGTYTATSMNEIWYSKEWDNAPMPHSIFFRKDGYAIHGSYEVKSLGKPASHGCVRISPENAATLFALVKKIGLKNTEVVLTGVTPGGEYKVARPEEPRYGQAGAGWYGSNNYYAQPQWGAGFFGRSFGGSYYNGSQGYYRARPPRGY
jgi:L,D-transpeptidase catalytic domain